MNPNSQYNTSPQAPYTVSGTPQQPTSPSTEVRKQRRHYPRIPQESNPAYPPQQPRTASPFLQQQQQQQFQGSPYQQPAQPSFYQQPAPYQQPVQNSPYQQPIQNSPYLQSSPGFQGSPYAQQQGYQQALNGISNMSINQAPRQDVPLVGQPPLVEDLHIEKSNPIIPPQVSYIYRILFLFV